QLELLMEVPDPEVFLWVTGERATPAAHDTALLHRLRAFHLGEPGAGSPPGPCATPKPNA
ncbi:MAG: succinate dehydrogenase assembly factor 2, partial [Xanthobacteraceae bacterium]